MRESEQSQMVLNQFDAQIVIALIDYLYTGATGALPEEAPELFCADNFFEFDDLKRECMQHMIANLDPQNAAYILQLAHFHQNNWLMEAVLGYIRR